MNRRQFFKRAAIVAAGAAAAPLVGKAPEVDAFAGPTDTGVAIDGTGSQFVVNGKAIGTVHSVEFSHPEWYDNDGDLWKIAIDHRHDNA